MRLIFATLVLIPSLIFTRNYLQETPLKNSITGKILLLKEPLLPSVLCGDAEMLHCLTTEAGSNSKTVKKRDSEYSKLISRTTTGSKSLVSQGRACHTEADGPTFVGKPVVHENIFHHLCPKNWSFLMTHLRRYFSSI